MFGRCQLTNNEKYVLAAALSLYDRSLVVILDSKAGEQTKANAEWQHYLCHELTTELKAL